MGSRRLTTILALDGRPSTRQVRTATRGRTLHSPTTWCVGIGEQARVLLLAHKPLHLGEGIWCGKVVGEVQFARLERLQCAPDRGPPGCGSWLLQRTKEDFRVCIEPCIQGRRAAFGRADDKVDPLPRVWLC